MSLRNARPGLKLGARFAFCLFVQTIVRTASASPSSTELVRQAAAHESAGENDIAVRRYSDAIAIDPTDGTAYLGLGALRLRLGDARESEVVYSAALAHLPDFAAALLGRANARWSAGWHGDAERDLQLYITKTAPDAEPLLTLAAWYDADAERPSELAVWRRLYILARATNDGPLAHRARTTVLALTILVDLADPATHPASSDATRRGMARIARRP